LHNKTNLDVYALYDAAERIYSWGRNYFHYCIKVDDTYYLNAKGLSTENELKIFWADLWNESAPNNPMYFENIKIVKKSVPSPYTGNADIDAELDKMGGGINIPDHVKNYADMLIDTYNLT